MTEWEKQRRNKVMINLRELGVHGTVSVSAKINFDSSEEMEEKVSEGTEISTSQQKPQVRQQKSHRKCAGSRCKCS
jgi:flagellar biosynthesis/type III secretory pathway M-ring protein FliF/YscJ